MVSTGIRELKNNLSRYVRQIEAGKRIAVTANGRIVAELVPPSGRSRTGVARRYDELVASGIIEPAIEPDLPPAEWPDIRAPAGTTAELIDSDRGEA
jgi:prevent-host-death family protein